MCAAATTVSGYRTHRKEMGSLFELDNEWDDRRSSDSENLHDALFSNEDAPLLGQMNRSSSKRNSLQETTNNSEDEQAAKKSKSEHSGFFSPVSPKRYSMLHEQGDNPGSVSSEKFKDKLQRKLTSKISGARFRWINEQLYTKTGEEALEMFEQEPSLFDVYHRGFTSQASKWPVNPLDRIITAIQNLPSSAVVADFGCGEARLAQSVPNTVYSFDLVATNSHVTACDMANVPLSNSSVDVCVFCLSLMGTNISDFIKEARRVLKKNGTLRICEIASRFESEDEFAAQIEKFGFHLIKRESFSRLFVDFEFKMTSRKKSSSSKSLPTLELKPCMYKRR